MSEVQVSEPTRAIIRAVLLEEEERRRRVEKEATGRVLNDVLVMLGIDPRDTNLSKELSELRADLRHTRRWRKSVEQVGTIGLGTAVTVILAGLLGAVWLGLRALMK